MTSRIAAGIALMILTTACASPQVHDASNGEPEAYAESEPATPDFTPVSNPEFEEIRLAPSKLERDRRAILAMRGEYRVEFKFAETVRLKAGYERRDGKVTGGWETVIVVVDSPNEIILQHILVSWDGHVTKHWRQHWCYEAGERFEFVADQTWALRKIEPELIKGAWTQCVYEVSDAPRYCGTGPWVHDQGVSTWTSDPSWRPLPRREYTIRDDYNALHAINRHTVTPHGWTHEQDNTKTVRDGTAVADSLVREFGFNDYQYIEGFDFQPAYDYWDRTRTFWAHVREAWDQLLWSGGALELTTDVDGMPIIDGTFDLADKVPGLSEQEQVDAIEALLQKWTRPVGDALALRK